MTPEKIGCALMTHVYTRLTCIIGHDASGNVADGYVLDTMYAREAVRPCEGAAGYWVILGHPGGLTEMDDMDEDVLARLRACAGETPIRVFAAGEDIGCAEIEASQGRGHVL